MATRGFSCPNCHTWFEGNGNHPKCPICGTRASPRDLLDDREHHAAMHEAPPPLRTAPGYDLPSHHEAQPIEYEPAPDYDLPSRHEPPPFKYQPAPDYDLPSRHEPPPIEYEPAPDYEEPRGWDRPHKWGEAQDEDGPYGYQAEPAGAPYRPAPSGESDSDWTGKIGPIIGVLIFAAVIIGRICEAAAG